MSVNLSGARPQQGLVASIPGQRAPLAAESVPLTGVRIDVVARGVASAVTVSQRYVNREKVPVEAVYSFPLEEQAAVYGFEALVGDKRVVGRIMEKDAAFDEYDRAMAEGDGAYLLDQDRPNLFTASIGNLLPGQQAVVTVQYVAPLERLGDQVRLKIPTTVAPRYIPAEQLRQMDPSEFDHLNPPTAPGGVPYGLALNVTFEGASRVTSVECPSHPAKVSTRGKKATVELSGADVQLDRDVVVTFTMKDAGATALYATLDDDGDTILMLDFLPPRVARREPVEAVFLIDRSGSMYGSSIAQARDALLLALSSLQEGDRFNVVGFGSGVEDVFEGCVAYDDAALNVARAAVQGWDADLGGTEIMTPLTRILEGRSGTLPRRLLVLTDGEVSNEAACLELAGRHPETAVFTIGVGYGASEHLVRGLARAGSGQAEFVHPGERIEPALMRQMARLTTAGSLDVSLDWGGLPVDLVAPAAVPPLYPGTPVTVFARVPAGRLDAAAGPGRDGGPVEVALVAAGPEGRERFAAAADLREARPDAAVPRLFARQAIRDLEEGRVPAAARGSRQRDRREGRAKDLLVDLATRYTLMSSRTSFVAVEERVGEAGADLPAAELRRIPVALLADWHGSGRLAWQGIPDVPDACRESASYANFAPNSVSDFSESPFPHATIRACDDAPMDAVRDFRESSRSGASSLLRRAGENRRVALVVLVSVQKADGSWRLDAATFEAFGIERERLVAAHADLAAAVGAGEEEAATAVALYVLRRLFADEAEQWRMAAEKAEAWLAARGLRGGPPALWPAVELAMAWWTPPEQLEPGAGTDS